MAGTEPDREITMAKPSKKPKPGKPKPMKGC
jgi:hypothetical protein